MKISESRSNRPVNFEEPSTLLKSGGAQDENEKLRRKLQQYIFGLEEIQEKAEDLAVEHEKLRHSLDLLNAILSTTSHGICLVKDNRIVWGNKGLADIFGWEQDELVGKGMDMLFGGDRGSAWKDEWIRTGVLPSGMANFECDLLRANGETIPCLVSGRLLDAGDTAGGYILSFTDFSERKQAERALQRAHDELERRVEERTRDLHRMNEQLNMELAERMRAEDELRKERERLATVLDGTPIPTAMIDQDHRILFWNRSLEAATSIQREDALGHTMEEALRPLYLGKPPSILADLVLDMSEEELLRRHGHKIRKGKSGEAFEVTAYLWIRGEKRTLDVLATLIRDHQGAVVGAIQCAQDVTDKEQLHQQLQHAQKMEAIGTLAGGIAHDFNNLLQAIHGSAEILLLTDREDKYGRAKLGQICNSAKRGGELVRQLLTFSRKVESKKRPIELNHEIRQVRRLLERTIPRMIDIEMRLTEDLKVVNADPVQVELVLINLAVNAKDAMPEGGKLIFTTENATLDQYFCSRHAGARPGRYALMTVTDTGHGMDKDILERIFEPFFTTKEIGKGTGLGLAMVYGVVKDHGGYITCESEPGKGTTFRIYLPVDETPSAPLKEAVKEVPVGGTEGILLVDDEDMLREIWQRVFEDFGYTVFMAPDGETALELYRSEREAIDLVVLDMIMPGMGGERCLQELLEINPDVRTLITSGHFDLDPEEKTLTAKARGVMVKPFNITQMLKRVREILDGD